MSGVEYLLYVFVPHEQADSDHDHKIVLEDGKSRISMQQDGWVVGLLGVEKKFEVA